VSNVTRVLPTRTGDGAGLRRRGLDTHHGWSLSLTDAAVPLGGDEGCVGAIG